MTVETATKDDWPQIAAYLDQKLLENAWLAGYAHDCLRCPGWEDSYVLVSRVDSQMAGVACVMSCGQGSLDVCLCGKDAQALQDLFNELPRDKTVKLRVYDSEVQSHLDKFSSLERHPEELYYRLPIDDFTPVSGLPVRELRAEDDALFDGCEQNPPQWEYHPAELRVFAILVDGRVATKVGVGLITPTMPSGRRVAAISGLYTETKHRRKGLGRRLVSYITELILAEGNIPMYWTEASNIPSQGLCRSLGYQQNVQEMRYIRKAVQS